MSRRDDVIRKIVLRSEKVPYTVRKSNRARYLRMTVSAGSGLVVTVPRFCGEHLVESFLREKATWILKQLRRMAEFNDKTVLVHSKEDYERNKHAFLKVITDRVEFFNSLYGFSYKKISIRNQTSLWGSCTRAGNLQFNYKLIKLSKEAIDYVVVHELCHLKEHNHSSRFWKLVAAVLPDYYTIRRSLRDYIMDVG